MSGLSHPNDEMNQSNYHFVENGAHLHPIDEAEDFYDPFSDLSLFLSKKIKSEIETSGDSKNWSGKIEANLLAKILPEFKEKFPKYRLGTSALKKMWDKVSYYYEKIQGQKGAVQENGSLNIKLMIRENLKTQTAPYHLPPYTIAEHIGVKLSECIATFEGKRPKVNHLTKIVWAVQKHLLKGLSAFETKSPYDEYDKIDKLIVKAQLEISSSGENLEPSLLKRKVLKALDAYSAIKTLAKENQLTSTLSMILAEKLYYSSLIACHFSLKEKKTIESFIHHQIELGKFNQELISDEHRLELIQRILALYAVATGLPKGIEEKDLRAMIHYVQKLNQKEKGKLPPEFDQALFVFINGELHLMNEGETVSKASEDKIVAAYKEAMDLPSLSDGQFEQFELLVWKKIEEEGNLLSYVPADLLALLEQELANTLIDNPKQSFRMIISTTLQFFKKINTLTFDKEVVQEKVDTWVAQGDMLIRSVHFDPRTPLLTLLEKEWKGLNLSEKEVNHFSFMNHTMEQISKEYPLLFSFEEQLERRLWILYKYLWYNLLTDGNQSTYDRFILWYKTLLRGNHPEWPREKLTASLEKLSDQLLPFAPFQEVV